MNMDQELHLEIVYENHLDTDKFARMFNNKAQSKFYWFEAILNLSVASEEDLTFEEMIDEMICEAWHTVTHYHLRLGPTVNGNAENFLEHAINTLNSKAMGLSQNPSKDELKQAIKECGKELKKDKYRLTDYVPYKLMYPFFDTKGIEYASHALSLEPGMQDAYYWISIAAEATGNSMMKERYDQMAREELPEEEYQTVQHLLEIRTHTKE